MIIMTKFGFGNLDKLVSSYQIEYAKIAYSKYRKEELERNITNSQYFEENSDVILQESLEMASL